MSNAFNAAAANNNKPAQEILDRSLLRAAEFGESGKITSLIRRGANKNARHTNGDTPLIIAAREGHDAAVQLLLKRGAEASLRNHQGESAADASRGDPAILRRLARAQQKQAEKERLKEAAFAQTAQDVRLLRPLRIVRRVRPPQ